MSSEIVKVEQRGIQAWADTPKMREFAAMLKTMLPNGAKLSEGETLALAQAAVEMQRNPLTGEIYAIPGKGVTEGYKGMVRGARQNATGEYHKSNPRPLTATETEEHDLKPGDIGRAVEVFIFEEKRKCTAMGIHYSPTIGIGILRKEEKFVHDEWVNPPNGKAYKRALPEDQWKPADPPTGKSWAWKAGIRAERDAFNQSGLQYLGPDEEGEQRMAQMDAWLTDGRKQREELLAALPPEQRAAATAEIVAQDEGDLYGVEHVIDHSKSPYEDRIHEAPVVVAAPDPQPAKSVFYYDSERFWRMMKRDFGMTKEMVLEAVGESDDVGYDISDLNEVPLSEREVVKICKAWQASHDAGEPSSHPKPKSPPAGGVAVVDVKVPFRWEMSPSNFDKFQVLLVERTNSYYHHLAHVENTLRQGGYTAVNPENGKAAMAYLVQHAQERVTTDELPVVVVETF